MAQLGKWAFILGLVIAILFAFIEGGEWVTWLLVILGLIVGFLNVTGTEVQAFLLAAIGLIVSAAAVQALPYVGDTVTDIVSNIVVFIAPAVLVVSLKALFAAARD